MESFIKNIFDIDKGAEDYQQRLEVEKQKLLKDRKDKIKVIDDEYNKVLEEEQENLKLHLSSIENEDKNKLVEYNEKSEAIKSVFEDKKEFEKFQNELKEKIKNEKDPKKRKELEKQIYKKLPNTESQLHNIKIDKNGEPYIDTTFPNEKYANNMGQEAVFEKKSGKWVKDGINDATYNIAINAKIYASAVP